MLFYRILEKKNHINVTPKICLAQSEQRVGAPIQVQILIDVLLRHEYSLGVNSSISSILTYYLTWEAKSMFLPHASALYERGMSPMDGGIPPQKEVYKCEKFMLMPDASGIHGRGTSPMDGGIPPLKEVYICEKLVVY